MYLFTRPSTYNRHTLVKQLGIWFDRKPILKAHARTLASKAKQTAGGIQALANTVSGVKYPYCNR